MRKHILFERQALLQKWLKNLVVFTGPALAVFFAQLASGVELRIAGGVALLALYGLLADYFRKRNEDL
jgi:hypothetical protein